MIRPNSSLDSTRADDAIDAYLAEMFGVGLERLLLDGVQGSVPAVVAGIATVEARPVARCPHGDGGLTEHFEGTLTLQGVSYGFRCETWSMPQAYVHRFLTNIDRFELIEWTARAEVGDGA